MKDGRTRTCSRTSCAASTTTITNEWHGRDGPLWVSDLRTENPFHARYVAAARQTGLPVTDDFNGAEQEGVGIYQVTQKNGERWSAARAYLLPHMTKRKNLSRSEEHTS